MSLEQDTSKSPNLAVEIKSVNRHCIASQKIVKVTIGRTLFFGGDGIEV